MCILTRTGQPAANTLSVLAFLENMFGSSSTLPPKVHEAVDLIKRFIMSSYRHHETETWESILGKSTNYKKKNTSAITKTIFFFKELFLCV